MSLTCHAARTSRRPGAFVALAAALAARAATAQPPVPLPAASPPAAIKGDSSAIRDSATKADTAAKRGTPADTTPKITFGAFVDGYYAWDFNQPRNFDRAFTTQPARHAEFNINLAYVEARLSGPRYRGRLALQYGTAVVANYAGEPHLGHVSGASSSQYLQEASVGYQVTPSVWLDGGIFFAHTGYEGWISRDNLTYSRSLIADYSPYYEAGVKLTWVATPKLTAQIDVVNGWQDISNYNTPPAVGVRFDYVASKKLTLSYDNFVGNVAADSAPRQIRFYNDFIAQITPSSRWQVAAVLDVGTQSHTKSTGGTALWYGTALVGKYFPVPRIGIVGRLERYDDPDQAIVQTGLGVPFRTNGASLGADVALVPRLLWRTEVRGFRSTDAVWPRHRAGALARDDRFVVTSLALTL